MMEKLYFVVGSQDLYGDECLKQVADDSKEMAEFLNEKLKGIVEVELLPTVETSEICINNLRKVSNDDDCVFVSSTRWQISLPFSFIIVFLFFCITNKPRLCTEQIFFL